MSNFLNLPSDKGERRPSQRYTDHADKRSGERPSESTSRRSSERHADRQVNHGEWQGSRDQIRDDYRQSRDQVYDRRHGHANHIRDHVHNHYYHHHNGHWYNWWDHCWGHHPYWSWWGVPRPLHWAAWGSLSGWCGGGIYYIEPIYYDYGYVSSGEYLVYRDGEPAASVDEYADSARELAATGAETISEASENNTAAEMEWLPLGVFAMTDKEDGEPIMFVQLAVAKDGTLGGTYYNTLTELETSVQGSVDNETQRAAFSIGENSRTVIETGVYNLTQDETTALVHFGDGKTQTWFMTRLPDPETAAATAEDAAASTAN